MSVSTHRTSVAVHQYTYQHAGPWTQHAGPSCGLFGTSVAVRQHTQDVCGYPCVSVCVHLCPSAHTGRPWLSISTHISTLLLGLSKLALPVDCLGDYGPCGQSVQYTQDVCGCPPAHTRRLWMSVCVRQHTQDVHGCPSAHTGRLCVSVNTHRTCLAVCVCPSVSVSTHMTSVAVHQYTYQHYTQDVRGCPPAHTGRLWLSVAVRQHTHTHRTSVAVRVCPCVSVRTPRTSVAVHHTHRKSVGVCQHTHDVCGCPLAHIGRLWLSMAVHQYTYQHAGPWTQHAGPSRGLLGTSVCVRQHTQDIHGCPCVSVSTHMTSVAFHQYTYQHVGPWIQHADPSRGLFGTSVAVRGFLSTNTGRPWLSVCVHQDTQNGCGCPSAHKGRPCVSVSTHKTCVADRVYPCVSVSTLRTSVAVHQDTYQHVGSWTQHADPSCGLFASFWPTWAVCSVHTGCPWVSASTHRTSVAVCGCPSAQSVAVRQHNAWLSLCVRVCPSAHKIRPWVFVSTHMTFVWTYQHVGPSTQQADPPRGLFGTSVAIRGCPSAHTGRLWLSVAVHQYTYQHTGPWTPHAGPSRGLFGTSVAVRQHTQDVCGYPCVSVCVRLCPSAHTGRPWLSISTHISTLLLGLSKLALPVDCLGDYGPCGQSVQYTQDVCGCPPAHTRRPWMSVCVRQHTQDVHGCPSAHTGRLCVSVNTHRTCLAVCVCPSVSVSTHMTSVAVHHTHRTSVAVRQHIQDVCDCLWLSVSTHSTSMDVRVCASVSVSTHITYVCVHQHTHDVRGCPCVSMCVRQNTQDVRGCPSVHISALHTGSPWVSASTHMTSVAVRGCPLAHTGRLWLSMAVHQYTYQHAAPWTQHAGPSRGLLGTSVCVRQHTQDIHVCPCVSVSTHMTSVAFHQYTYQHVGPWIQHADPSRGLFGTSVAVRGFLSTNTGRPWLSVCVHQDTQNDRGCPSAHKGRPCVSVSTHKTCVADRVCPSAHSGRLWLSIKTHISTLVLGLSTLTLPVDCLRHFGPRGLSVQYTQDVRGCPPAHTGRPWLSVAVRQHNLWLSASTMRGCPCVSVCVRQHTKDVHGRHINTLVLRLSKLTLPVDCLGDFGPQGLSVQYTQDVHGCPPAHTGHPWLSVAVRQHTQDVCGCLWLSISTHISTLVLGLRTLALPVDCSGDFGPRRLSVQYTQAVHGTHRTSVAVLQYTYQHVGPWTQHADPSRGLFGTSVAVRGFLSTNTGRLWLSVCARVCQCVSIRTHKTSVSVRQHTHDVRGCPSAHTGRVWLTVCVRQHTQDVRRPLVSASTHRTFMAVRVCLCVYVCVRQHTQDGRGCQSVHISACCTHRMSVGVCQHTQDIHGCLWLSVSTHKTFVAVLVCPCVSVSTHKTSVEHTGRPWLSISTHISKLVLGLSTLTLPVDCSGDFGPCGLSVQYTKDVCGFPPAHTGRLWLSVSTHMTSVAVHVCPCESVSTHRTSVAVHQYTYQHAGPWTQQAGPSCGLFRHRTSVAVHQHKQDVCGCSCVSVCVRQHTQDVRGCPSVHISARWSLDSAHWPFLWTVWVILAHVGCLFGTHRTFVGVRQHTQDVRGCLWLSVNKHRTSVAVRVCLAHRTCVADRVYPCVSVSTHRTSSGQYPQDVRWCPPAHTGRPWLSVCVRVCLSVSVSTHRTAVAVNQYTYQHVGPWTQHTGPSRGLFVSFWPTWAVCSVHTGCPWVSASTHRTSMAVRGCPSAPTRRPWLSVCVRQHTQGCPTHRTSVAVHQYTYQHAGPWTQQDGPSYGLFRRLWPTWAVCSVHTGRLWVSASRHRTSVAVRQHTQDVHGHPCVSVCVRLCPSAHTGRPTSVAVCQHTHDVRGCPCVSVGVRQHTQDGHCCQWLSVSNTGRPVVSVSTHRTSVCVRVCPCVSVSPHKTSGAVHQYTYQHAGPWIQHAGPSRGLFGTFVAVHQHKQDVCGCPCVSVTLALPVDCLGDFGPRGLSGTYTQDVCGCPPAHTGRPWLTSVAVHQYTYQHAGPWTQHAGPSCGLFGTSVCVRLHTQDVRGCPCVSVGIDRTSVAVHLYTYQHAGPWTQHAVHTRRPWVSVSTNRTSVCVRQHTHDVCGCPCVSDSTHWTSVAVHQYTYQHVVPWTQHAGPSHGLFGTSVAICQHTHDVRGCPCVSVGVRQHTQDGHGCQWLSVSNTVRPIVSVSTNRTSVCVRVCLSADTGRLWLSNSTHISMLVLGLSTLTHPVDCLGDFGPRGMSIQYTQDVRGTHISTLVLGLSTLALPVDCSGDFGPRGCLFSTHRTSVGVSQHTQDVYAVHQHKQDVCGCPCVSVYVRLHTQDVRGCPSVHISARWTSVGVRQHTQDVCGLHTGHPWLSISTHISTLVLGLSTLALPVDCSGDFGPRGLSVQYTQDVCGCPSAHTGRPCVSVCTPRTSVAVRVCPSAQTGRPWLSICTHISTLVLGLSTLVLPLDCSGDFGPRGLSVQYTHDVRGCPSAQIGRPFVSVSTHRTSVAVHVCPTAHTGRPTSVAVCQHTHDVRGCPCVSVGVRQHTQDGHGCQWLSVSNTERPIVSVSTNRTSVCVRVCLSADTGRMWLSNSTHISMLVLGLSTLTHPVDCLGDFGPRGMSIQYTQDVRGCPPAHTGRLWLSMCFRMCPSAHTGRSCLSISTHISTLVLGLSTLALPVDCSCDFGPRGCLFSTHRTSVGVSQHTQDVCGCPSAQTGRLWLSVCVCVCPSAHTGRPWLSISTHISTLVLGFSTLALPVDCLGDFGPRGLSGTYTQDVCGCPPAHTGRPWLTHISTLVLGLSTLALPVDCSGDFGPRGLSVQYTQDVCGCPSAHTGRLCVSVCTPRTSVAVRVCPSAQTGRPWLSICTHISTLVLGLSTLALPLDCSGDFGPRGLSVQYTHDVLGCPSAQIGRPFVSVSTHRTSVAVHVCPTAHTGRPTSVAVCQHTHDVRGCPFVSVGVRQHTQNGHGCQWLSVSNTERPIVSVSTNRTSMCVRVCLSADTGRMWLSNSTHISMLVLGLSTLTHPVDCLGDFGPRGMSVQYTQDVRWCPPAHTGRLWLSMCFRMCLSAHTGRSCLSISTHISTLVLGLSTLALPVDCSGDFGPRGCLFSTHRTSVGVSQHTQDVCGCPSAQTRRLWLSVCVCVCPSVHTGRPWLSISTHISTLVLGFSTLALPVDCLGDFGQRGLSGTYTQGIRGCPPAHTGRPWLTHRTSVAVHQYTYQHAGPWTQHAGPSCGLFDFGPRGLSVQYTQDVRGCPSAHTGRPCVSVYTPRMSVAVRVCPSAHTGRPSAHTGRPWLSISTHISTLVLGLSMLALPVDCSGDFGPCGLSVQYTQDVRGCPSAQIGRPFVSVSTHRTSVAVCVCPSAHTGRPWLSISTHISTLVLGLSTLTLAVDCSGDFVPRGLSVKYTQDVCGCLPAHTGRPWLSVCLRVCPSMFFSTHRTFVAVHQYTYQHVGPWTQHVGPWTQHAGPSRGLFGTSVAHTQDVRGCPSAHTGRPCVSISTHRTSVAVLVFPCVSVSTHMTSVSVHQYTYQHVGPWTQHADPSRGLCGGFWPTWAVCSVHTGRLWVSASTHRTSVAVHVLSVCVRRHTQDVRGCPSTHTGHLCVSVSTHRTSMAVRVCLSAHRMSVAVHPYTYQHVVHTERPWVSASIQRTSMAVRGCLSAHTGRLWQSISTHISTLILGLGTLALPVDCSGDFGPRGLSVQYTQDVCGCPTSVAVRVCPCVSVSTHRTSVATISTHISTLVPGLSTLTLPVDCSGDFGPRGLSVQQYTQDVRGCPPAYTGRPCVSASSHRMFVAVRVCLSAHTGRLWLSISTHISTLVLGLSTLTLPVDCLGDFGPRGRSVPYTQDVRACPPAHTGRLWLSVSTHRTSVAVRVCPSAHTVLQAGNLGKVLGNILNAEDLAEIFVMLRKISLSPLFGLTKIEPVRLQIRQLQNWIDRPILNSMLLFGSERFLVGLETTSKLGCSQMDGLENLRMHENWFHGKILHGWYRFDGRITQEVRGCPLYTQDVCGCPSAHTGRPCVSVSTHRTSVAVRVYPCVSDSTHMTFVAVQHTHRTSVGVRQNTQGVRGCLCESVCIHLCPSAHTGRLWLSASTHMTSVAVHVSPCVSVCLCQHTQDVRVCPSAHTGRLWLSISTHISTLVLGLSTLTLPVDCSGDFGPRGLSVRYTQDVRGCPPAHTGRPCVSVSTHRTSVAVRVCPCVSVSTHRTSVAVHQYTYQHAGPWTQHADPSRGLFGLFWPMWAICSVHTGRPWVSTSTHRTSVAVRQHTQDVCGCPCVSVSTHSVTGLEAGSMKWMGDGSSYRSILNSMLWFGSERFLVGLETTSKLGCSQMDGLENLRYRFDGRITQEVRGCPLYTQDVRGCPSAHTGRPCVSIITHRTSVAVRVCPCVSDSTHMTFVAVQQYTYQHVGPWTQHADPSRGLFSTYRTSVGVHQHTQDVRGCLCESMCVRLCPLAHTGRPCVSISTHMTSMAVHHTHRTSVGVHQHTQDVHVFLSAHTGRPWLSVCVRVCLSAHTGRLWLSISTHISMLVLGLSTLTLPVDCLGYFGPRGRSVQYTQDVHGCPPAHTGRPWLSVSTHRTSVAVRVSVSTHSVSGWEAGSMKWMGDGSILNSMLWFGSERFLVGLETTSKLGCSQMNGLENLRMHENWFHGKILHGWYRFDGRITQEVRGCPLVHISARWTSVAVRVCPCVSDSTHMTFVAVQQYITPHVGPWTQHADSSRGLFGTSVAVRVSPSVSVSTHRTSVGVRQHTQDVRGCPCESIFVRLCPSAHTGRPCLSISTHRTSVAVHHYTYQHLGPWTQHAGPSRGQFGEHMTSVAVHQYTYQYAVHTGRPWVSVTTHMTSVCVRQHTQDIRGSLCVSVSTHRTSVAVHQYTYQHAGPWTQQTGPSRGLFGTPVCVHHHTQDVRVCPSVAVRVCPTVHTWRSWLSSSTHISTLVLGLSTLTLPLDCSADFGPLGLSVRYTQDVRGTSMAVHQYTYQLIGPWTQHAGPSRGLFGYFGPRGLSVQCMQDIRGCLPAHTGRSWLSISTHTTSVVVRGCPCVSVCVRVCPSAHTGRMLVSVSTHRMSVCVGQYTQDVCGCPCVSYSTHKMSVAVHQYTYQHVGPWTQHADPSRGLFGTYMALRVSSCVSVCVCQPTQDVRGGPSVHISARCLFSTQKTSVGVRQLTQDVCGCPCVSVSTQGLPVDCSGDFGPRGLSVQYTQDVRGSPSAHTGRPSVSISTHRTSVYVHPGLSVCVRQYTYQHVGPWTQHADPSRGLFWWFWPTLAVCSVHTRYPWVSASTHRTSVAVCLSPCVSVCVRQHTQDICGCPSVHISARWSLDSALPVDCLFSTHRTSVVVRVCLCVSVSTHRTSVGVRQHTQDVRVCPTHNSTFGYFGPRGLSVQYTQDVCGCPPAHIGPHTGRPWVSISTHRMSVHVRQYTQDVCGCPTHRTSVGVRQDTQDVCGSQSAHTGRLWLSVCVCQHTQDVRGCPQHTLDVRVCPPAHIACPWLSVGFRQHTQDVRGCPCVSVGVRQHTQDVYGCPWLSLAVCGCPSEHTGLSCLSVNTHMTSVCDRQHTQDVRGCPTHMTSVAVHQYTYQHDDPWTQHTGPSRGLFGTSVGVHQHTQDVRVCPFGAVRVCPTVHISARCTHRTSVGVRQHTQDVRGCPFESVCVRLCPSAHTGRLWLSISTHISSLVLGLSTLALPVDCLAHTVRLWVSVSTHRTSVYVRKYTQDVRGRPCVSAAHTGCPWLSISTHISTLVLGLSMVALPVDCLGDFGPRGLSVQYTQDVCGCSPAHTRCLWLSVSTHTTSVAVRVCPSAYTGQPWVFVSTHRMSVCVCQHTQHVRGCLWLSVSTYRTSVAVRVCPCVSVCVRGCPPAHTGRLWLSLAVRQNTQDVLVSKHTGRECVSVRTQRTSMCLRMCPSAHTGRMWLSISTHISTLVLELSTLALPMDCLGNFGPRGLSVQYTQDVRGCPPRSWLSISTHRMSVAVRVCLCVSGSTHRTSVALHQYTYQHAGPSRGLFGTHRMSVAVRVCPCVSVSTHRMSLAVNQYTYQHVGDFGPCGLSVQYTQGVRGCPPAHTGSPLLSVCVRVCPSASFNTYRTSVAVHQYTYQHVGPWTQHAGPSRRLFG
ncbi:hypothetical protein YC2023_066103 [Brassica napus]